MFELLAGLTGLFSTPSIMFIGEMFGDLNLVLKIFVLMAIFAYVTQHLGKGPLAILIIVGMSYFIIFDYWKFFGGVYVLYMLVMLGIGGVLIDFMFITPSAHGGSAAGAEGATGQISNGMDFMKRQAQMQKARRGR
jgi:hypothetical protein